MSETFCIAKKFEYLNATKKPPIPSKEEKPIMGLVSEKNYIVANAVSNILAGMIVASMYRTEEREEGGEEICAEERLREDSAVLDQDQRRDRGGVPARQRTASPGRRNEREREIFDIR